MPALAVVLGLAAAGPARAQVPAPADSVAVAEAPVAAPRPAIVRPQARPKRPFDEPRWVMLRSLVVPGWGQLDNRAWLKALIVAGIEFDLGRKVVDDLRALDRFEADIAAARAARDAVAEVAAIDAYNARLDVATRREWLLGATVAYALLDAYIDAHFRNFEAEFQYDPALPGGVPPARARLSLRWRF